MATFRCEIDRFLYLLAPGGFQKGQVFDVKSIDFCLQLSGRDYEGGGATSRGSRSTGAQRQVAGAARGTHP